jgi:VWFA-related protein
MIFKFPFRFALLLLVICALLGPALGQDSEEKVEITQDGDVRVMTIPISIFTEKELEKKKAQEFVEAGEIVVREDGDLQSILSIRSVSNQPLALAVLIQDDLTLNINNQLKDLAGFITGLPNGSRVMVAYAKSGSIQIRQKFTTDLEEAADSLRIVVGSPSAAPRNPYDGVIETLRRFDGVPSGRRAVLLISDGLDISNGASSSTPSSSLSLDQAILRAQRTSVAVYSFYASATYTSGGNSALINNGQGSLLRLSKETGGKAFFQGSLTAVSYKPFFRELDLSLTRQFALSYLSTHMKKGYHKVEVTSTNPVVKIDHPKGYYYRKRR